MTQRKIIRRREVLARTGLTYVTQWRMERQGTFPVRVQLNPEAENGAVGWYEDEIDEWIRKRVRIAARRQAAAVA